MISCHTCWESLKCFLCLLSVCGMDMKYEKTEGHTKLNKRMALEPKLATLFPTVVVVVVGGRVNNFPNVRCDGGNKRGQCRFRGPLNARLRPYTILASRASSFCMVVRSNGNLVLRLALHLTFFTAVTSAQPQYQDRLTSAILVILPSVQNPFSLQVPFKKTLLSVISKISKSC